MITPHRSLSRAAKPDSEFAPPGRWEIRGVYVLFAAAILFGALVEMRSAFMNRRMTDAGVYFRAAWAVRAGANLYDITDDNSWHYNYPPLFAILMTPLADPPSGVDRAGFVPYPVSVGIWYVINLVCLIFGVHALATAFESRTGKHVPRGCRRWWSLRLIPFLACVVPIAHTLMRGQVNVLLLALLCGALAALIRGQSGRAGLWLAGAICLKVIPVFLLLVPLWRRDYRCLTGTAAGLMVGLILIPAAVFGVPRTIAYYQEYDQKLLRPSLGTGTDQSRDAELLGSTANDSQSILSAIHNTLYRDRYTRPVYPSSTVRWANRLIGALLTGLTLLVAWRKPAHSSTSTALFFGGLSLVMLFITPVCHLHYFALSLPLVMGLVAVSLQETPAPHRIGLGLMLLFWAFFITNALPNVPGMEKLRDLGIAMYGGLLLWGACCICIWRQTRRRERAIELSVAKAA